MNDRLGGDDSLASRVAEKEQKEDDDEEEQATILDRKERAEADCCKRCTEFIIAGRVRRD